MIPIYTSNRGCKDHRFSHTQEHPEQKLNAVATPKTVTQTPLNSLVTRNQHAPTNRTAASTATLYNTTAM